MLTVLVGDGGDSNIGDAERLAVGPFLALIPGPSVSDRCVCTCVCCGGLQVLCLNHKECMKTCNDCQAPGIKIRQQQLAPGFVQQIQVSGPHHSVIAPHRRRSQDFMHRGEGRTSLLRMWTHILMCPRPVSSNEPTSHPRPYTALALC